MTGDEWHKMEKMFVTYYDGGWANGFIAGSFFASTITTVLCVWVLV
jgi:hypothetical protein